MDHVDDLTAAGGKGLQTLPPVFSFFVSSRTPTISRGVAIWIASSDPKIGVAMTEKAVFAFL